MIIIFNAIFSVFAWLILFERHLIDVIDFVPLGEIIATLTTVDYFLLIATYVVVHIAMQLIEKFYGRMTAKNNQHKPVS